MLLILEAKATGNSAYFLRIQMSTHYHHKADGPCILWTKAWVLTIIHPSLVKIFLFVLQRLLDMSVTLYLSSKLIHYLPNHFYYFSLHFLNCILSLGFMVHCTPISKPLSCIPLLSINNKRVITTFSTSYNLCSASQEDLLSAVCFLKAINFYHSSYIKLYIIAWHAFLNLWSLPSSFPTAMLLVEKHCIRHRLKAPLYPFLFNQLHKSALFHSQKNLSLSVKNFYRPDQNNLSSFTER